DRELQLACVRAYNDWICEFNMADRQRLVGLGIAPLTGVEDLLDEFRRIVKMGLKGIILGAYPNGGFSPDPAVHDRFWAEAEEVGLPVHIHFGFFPSSQGGDPDKPLDMSIPVVMRMGIGVYKPLADLVHYGVFEKFPRLKVVAVETGIGWIPFFLQTIDDNYLRQRWHIKSHLKRMPSEYFRENIYATFVTDRLGLERRHDFGLEH